MLCRSRIVKHFYRFSTLSILYGVDSRGNAGFGFWQMAYAGDGTAEA